MTLYSRNGAKPGALPFRITLSSGATRTDPTSFTAEEIADAGYVEAPDAPAFDPATQRLDWTGSNWLVVDLPPPGPNLSPLQRWRFKAMLNLTGHKSDIDLWLASLLDPESPNYDPVQWAMAEPILNDSDEYRFDHPLTETLRQIADVTVEQLMTLWDHAHSL